MVHICDLAYYDKIIGLQVIKFPAGRFNAVIHLYNKAARIDERRFIKETSDLAICIL